MQSVAEPLTNGKPDVWADLERRLRQGAAPASQPGPGTRVFLTSARGIIHVGAHTGQERDAYGYLPVVWVEALPQAWEVLRGRTADKPHQQAICRLVVDGGPHKFGVASNAGQSSSIFDF